MPRDELLDRVNIPRGQLRAIVTVGADRNGSAAVVERHISEMPSPFNDHICF